MEFEEHLELDEQLESLMGRCMKLANLDTYQISARLDVNDPIIMDAFDAMEELACKLEQLEMEYIQKAGRSPLVNERAANPVGLAHMLLQQDYEAEDWICILRACLSETNATLRSNLTVKLRALHMLVSIYEWETYENSGGLAPSLPIEHIVSLHTLLAYAYGDAFSPEFQHKLVNDRKSAAGTPMLIRKRHQRSIDDQIAKQVLSWWAQHPADALLLRQRASCLLGSLLGQCDRKSSEYILEPHIEKCMPVPFPNVLFYRLRTELIPRYEGQLAGKAGSRTPKSSKKKRKSKSIPGGLHAAPALPDDTCNFDYCDGTNNEIRYAMRICSSLANMNKRMLRFVIQENVLELIQVLLRWANADQPLAFDVLELAAQIVIYKKVSLAFINGGGIHLLYELATTTKSVSFLNAPVAWCFSNLAVLSMESICQLSMSFLEGMVTHMLVLAKCKQNATRQAAITFFYESLKCPLILDLFERAGGPRIMMDILSNPGESQGMIKVEHVVLSLVQVINHYFRTHVAIAAHRVRQSVYGTSNNHHVRERSTSVHSINSVTSSASRLAKRQIARDKPLEIDDVTHNVEMHFLQTHRASAVSILNSGPWTPLEHLLRTGDEGMTGIHLLLRTIHEACILESPRGYSITTAINALQVLRVVTLLPFTYKLVCECNVPTDIQDESILGITVLLETGVGPTIDAELISCSLEVLGNCCSPSYGEDRQQRPVRRLARDNNALMTLLSLLRYNDTPKLADNIRYLACLVLNGLSNDIHVAQVLETLNIIQVLTKIARSEPVLVENKKIHKKLQREAVNLIQNISGTQSDGNIGDAADETNRRLLKNLIVDKTPIAFDSNELLGLIHEHLKEHGFIQAAEALKSALDTELHDLPGSSGHLSWPAKYFVDSGSSSVGSKSFGFLPKQPVKRKKSANIDNKKRRRSSLGTSDVRPTKRVTCISKRPAPSTSTKLEKMVEDYLREQHRKCLDPVTIVPPFSLTKEHRCKKDSLHRLKFGTSYNIGMRLIERELTGRKGGIHTRAQNVRLVHGRARWTKSFKFITRNDVGENNDDDDEIQDTYSSLCFYKSNGYEDLLFGTNLGHVVLRSLTSCHTFAKWNVMEREISSVTVTPDNTRLISCSQDSGEVVVSRLPSTLTSPFDMNNRKYHYNENRRNYGEDELVELWKGGNIADIEIDYFGRSMIATALNPQPDGPYYAANLYDLDTGSIVNTFTDKKLSSRYKWHRACFAPGTDNMILHDGLLWDVRSQKIIHKLDKLSECGMGTFRPDGTQVVVDSAVWDLRTFKLLLMCPVFENALLQFDSSSSVVYSFRPEIEPVMDLDDKAHSSYSVTDSSDFSNITTTDLFPQVIRGMTLSPDGQKLAIITDKGTVDTTEWDFQRRQCRVYDIGRVRPIDDDEDDHNQSDDESTDSEMDDDVDVDDSSDDADDDSDNEDEDGNEFDFDDDEDEFESADGDQPLRDIFQFSTRQLGSGFTRNRNQF